MTFLTGIGVIKLDLVNPDESRVLYDAHYNEPFEWGFVNYLFELNADYKTFIEASIDIMKTEALYCEKFDKVLSQQEILTCVPVGNLWTHSKTLADSLKKIN